MARQPLDVGHTVDYRNVLRISAVSFMANGIRDVIIIYSTVSDVTKNNLYFTNSITCTPLVIFYARSGLFLRSVYSDRPGAV